MATYNSCPLYLPSCGGEISEAIWVYKMSNYLLLFSPQSTIWCRHNFLPNMTCNLKCIFFQTYFGSIFNWGSTNSRKVSEMWREVSKTQKSSSPSIRQSQPSSSLFWHFLWMPMLSEFVLQQCLSYSEIWKNQETQISPPAEFMLNNCWIHLSEYSCPVHAYLVHIYSLFSRHYLSCTVFCHSIFNRIKALWFTLVPLQSFHFWREDRKENTCWYKSLCSFSQQFNVH